MIIDFHTHCFPDAIARRAVDGLSKTGGITPNTDGTLGDLKSLMASQNVSYFVVNNISSDARRQKNVNDFAISSDGGACVSFGSVHPFAENAEEELARLKEAGIAGIKFHPYFQDFFVDDERAFPVYEKAAELGFIILFHAGCDISFEDTERAAPERFAKVLDRLESAGIEADIVLAHWGGSMMTERVIGSLCGRNVYFDTSFGAGNITEEQARRVVKLHGADRILFGSDCPWHTPLQEKNFIDSLGLGKDAGNKIYYENAASLLEKHGRKLAR